MSTLRALVLLALGALSACGASPNYIPGTQVSRSARNEAIIERLEAYRVAVERRDAAALLLMASKSYWDDAGTTTGTDDYGRASLQRILAGRFQEAGEIRYAMKYMAIEHRGDKAFVDVLVDASFSVKDAQGQTVRRDLRDQNQFVLEHDGETWKFLSGM